MSEMLKSEDSNSQLGQSSKESDSWKAHPPGSVNSVPPFEWNFYREQGSSVTRPSHGAQTGNLPQASLEKHSPSSQENSGVVPSSKLSSHRIGDEKLGKNTSQGSLNLFSPQTKLKESIISSVQRHAPSVQQSTNYYSPASITKMQADMPVERGSNTDGLGKVEAKSSISPYDFAENELTDSRFEKPGQRLYHKSPPRKLNFTSMYNKECPKNMNIQRNEQLLQHVGANGQARNAQYLLQEKVRNHELLAASQLKQENLPKKETFSPDNTGSIPHKQDFNSVMSGNPIHSHHLQHVANDGYAKDCNTPRSRSPNIPHERMRDTSESLHISKPTLSGTSVSIFSQHKQFQNHSELNSSSEQKSPSSTLPPFALQGGLQPNSKPLHHKLAEEQNVKNDSYLLDQMYKQQIFCSVAQSGCQQKAMESKNCLTSPSNNRSENMYRVQKSSSENSTQNNADKAFANRFPFNPPASIDQNILTPSSLKEQPAQLKLDSADLKTAVKRMQTSTMERSLFPNGVNPMPNLQQVQQQIWNFFNGIGIENMWDQMRGSTKEQDSDGEPVKKKKKKKKKVVDATKKEDLPLISDDSAVLSGENPNNFRNGKTALSDETQTSLTSPQIERLDPRSHEGAVNLSSALSDTRNTSFNHSTGVNGRQELSISLDKTSGIHSSHDDKTVSSLPHLPSSTSDVKTQLSLHSGNESNSPGDKTLPSSAPTHNVNSDNLSICDKWQDNLLSKKENKFNSSLLHNMSSSELLRLNQNKFDHYKVDAKDGSLKRQGHPSSNISKLMPVYTSALDRVSLPGMSYFTSADLYGSENKNKNNSVKEKHQVDENSGLKTKVGLDGFNSGNSVDTIPHTKSFKSSTDSDQGDGINGNISLSSGFNISEMMPETIASGNIEKEGHDKININCDKIKQEDFLFSSSCTADKQKQPSCSAQKLEWDPEFVNSNQWISDILGNNDSKDERSITKPSVSHSNSSNSSVSNVYGHLNRLPYGNESKVMSASGVSTEQQQKNSMPQSHELGTLKCEQTSTGLSHSNTLKCEQTFTGLSHSNTLKCEQTSTGISHSNMNSYKGNQQIQNMINAINDISEKVASVSSFNQSFPSKAVGMDTCIKSSDVPQTCLLSAGLTSTSCVLPSVSSAISNTPISHITPKTEQGSMQPPFSHSSSELCQTQTSVSSDRSSLHKNIYYDSVLNPDTVEKVVPGESQFSMKDSLNSEMFPNERKDDSSEKLHIHPHAIKQENCDITMEGQQDSSGNFLSNEEVFRLDERLRTNTKIEIPDCGCLGPDYVYNESIEGPYYTHLGAAKDIPGIRTVLENRTGFTGSAIRIEKIIYTGKEGKSSQGCPIAKWIIRRSGHHEKLLCLVRQRPGHQCDTACIIVTLTAWEGVPRQMADDLYSYVTTTVTDQGFETDRRCGANEKKTCGCQGMDLKSRGASFSFGCSWSMYFNGCKFARSRDARKFKLKDTSQEHILEDKFQNLATHVGPLYAKIAPDAHRNQTRFEKEGRECRLGKEPGRPFCGVTSCLDFCAHAHKDLHNMNNGSTVVVTLTKHRGLEKPEDEQLHVLPLYVMDMTDEFGSIDGQLDKIESSALEVLENYPLLARIRAFPLTPKKKGKNAKKDNSASKRYSPKRYNPAKSKQQTSQAQTPLPRSQSVPLNVKEEPNHYVPEFPYQRPQSQCSSPAPLPDRSTSFNSDFKKPTTGSIHPALKRENMSYPELMTHSFNPYFPMLYEKFWNYFYAHGVFPPHNVLSPFIPFENMFIGDRLGMMPGNIYPHDLLNQGHPQQVTIKQEPPDLHQNSNSEHFKSCSKENPKNSSQGNFLHPSQVMAMNNGLLPNFSLPQSDSAYPLNLTSQGEGVKRNLSNCAYEQPTLSNSAMNRDSNNVQWASNSQTAPLDLSSVNQPIDYRCKEAINRPANLHSDTAAVNRPASVENRHCDNQFNNASAVGAQFHMQSSQGSSLPNQLNSHSNDRCQSANPLTSPGANSGKDMPFQLDMESRPDCSDGCMRDPHTLISCEMEYNEQSFADPRIGGVAIALTHGAVLFEVAKRELHATTALRNPDRYNPTRISLVFYQHKNLNYSNHGWKEYEQKLELLKQKRLEKLRKDSKMGIVSEPQPTQEGKKKKKKKSDTVDFAKTSAAKYKYMWEAPARRETSLTTNTFVTSWIDPQPIVTGPYQKYNGYQ